MLLPVFTVPLDQSAGANATSVGSWYCRGYDCVQNPQLTWMHLTRNVHLVQVP